MINLSIPSGWQKTGTGLTRTRTIRGWKLEIERDDDNGKFLWTVTFPEGDPGECGNQETVDAAALAAERVIDEIEAFDAMAKAAGFTPIGRGLFEGPAVVIVGIKNGAVVKGNER